MIDESKSEGQSNSDDQKLVSWRAWVLDWWPLLAALSLLLIAFVIYAYNFFWPAYPDCIGRWDERQCLMQSLADDKSGWGQLGDYMGGLVNPVIGLLTIVLLVRSLRQNEKALSLSREELEATRAAVTQAVDAQKQMENSLSEQIKEARSQNNFANYYKHLEEFTKHLSSVQVQCENVDLNINVRKTHLMLFPGSDSGNFNMGLPIKKKFYRAIIRFADVFLADQQFVPMNIASFHENECYLVESAMQDVLEYSCDFDLIKAIPRRTVPDDSVIKDYYESQSVLTELQVRFEALCHLLSFDQNFDTASADYAWTYITYCVSALSRVRVVNQKIVYDYDDEEDMVELRTELSRYRLEMIHKLKLLN